VKMLPSGALATKAQGAPFPHRSRRGGQSAASHIFGHFTKSACARTGTTGHGFCRRPDPGGVGARGTVATATGGRISAKIAKAIHYAHERAFCTGLKPSNVLIDADTSRESLNFGLAKRLESPPS